MKVIKDLAVTVTYTVELGGVEVPDKVFEQLNNMAKYGISVGIEDSEKYEKAFEWLMNNIREDDAMEWEYEVGIDE
ncbi:MAG: hypothetical protein ACFNS7_05845 [Capnocytophaga granulosa]|jgi:hypothetical protein|nr:MAG TPA: hypothetical protein [Caudoviricetes sp.]